MRDLVRVFQEGNILSEVMANSTFNHLENVEQILEKSFGLLFF